MLFRSPGERAQEEAAEDAAVSGSVGVALAVCVAPRRQVVRRVLAGEEAVSASESDGVGQDCATDSVSY